ncbi:MAG TPA: 30S ribosome-binding factor RbfA [Coriobacteriia bacterium]|nr:30S ribosome-binding factor RbfA [Coriobacteriia bacterium]
MRESFGRKSDERVRETIAEIVASEISDPRVTLVTVTGAKVSSDRSVAEVFVSASPERYDEVLEGLESAKGRIRSILGHRLGWRVSPELRFHIDVSVDEGQRISVALGNVPPTLVNGEGAEPSVPEDEE